MTKKYNEETKRHELELTQDEYELLRSLLLNVNWECPEKANSTGYCVISGDFEMKFTQKNRQTLTKMYRIINF